jgi:hypothetical protein
MENVTRHSITPGTLFAAHGDTGWIALDSPGTDGMFAALDGRNIAVMLHWTSVARILSNREEVTDLC